GAAPHPPRSHQPRSGRARPVDRGMARGAHDGRVLPRLHHPHDRRGAAGNRDRTDRSEGGCARMTDHAVLDEYEAGELSVLYDVEPPEEVLAWALDRLSPNIAISEGGGAEGMAIIDMASRIRDDVRVFTMDTGRLPQETYDLMARIEERYGIRVEMLFPERAHVEGMTQRHGPNLMYDAVDLRLLCCQVRKVLPLNRYLETLEGWITGLRREQWASRAEVRKIELDHDHGGIVKVNPLADWTKDEVWDYIRANDVPYHALYDQGYT